MRAFHVGKVHDIRIDIGGHDFVHLFLAVACRLANDLVSDTEKRTGFAHACAKRSLDERAHVSGQVFLALGYPELRATAEAGYDTVAGDDDLVRHVCAERAEYLAALGLFVDEFLRADAVYIGHDHVPERHAFRSVLLR